MRSWAAISCWRRRCRPLLRGAWELAPWEAGSLPATPGTLSFAWHEEDAHLSVVAQHAPMDEATGARWAATARTLLGSALEASRARARIDKLEKSRRLQQALYEIAELASAEGETGDMLHRLHAIIGSLMYAPNCYIVTYDDTRGTLRFIYFADEVDSYEPHPDQEWAEDDMPNSLTFALLRHGRALRGPSNLIRRALQVPHSAVVQGPDSQDWLGVPMKRGDRVCGAIVVQSYDRPASYTDEDRALLGYVAQHVLTTIDRRQATIWSWSAGCASARSSCSMPTANCRKRWSSASAQNACSTRCSASPRWR